MLLRTVILAATVFVTLATGVNLMAEDSPGSRRGLQSAQQRDLASSRSGSKPTRKDDSLGSPIDSFANTLGSNKELMIYAAIASFGVLMMGLAIGNASSSAKKKTDAQLEILKQEKEKAENLAKLKSEFLNQVSHELRTPLAVIIGYIECITDGLYGEIETKHQDILQIVAKQSAHLKNMIDQILIYSRLEAGKQPVKIEEMQLAKSITDLKDTFDFLCRQKGIDLHWDLSKNLMPIRSDVARVKEVVSNLLQNAVKYTDQGSITVRVEMLPSQEAVVIEVADTGMGISEQNLTSIFEPFMQVHKTSSEHSRGGIGLGLSIVKKHLDQIRGTINVTSELGKGSAFRIVLPRNYDRPRAKASWLFGLAKAKNPRNDSSHAMVESTAATRRHKPANTSQAIG